MKACTSIDDFIKQQGWRFRLRCWFARIKVRRMLRKGWRPTVYTLCFDCLHPIIEADDDACVCTKCGGRNRRILSP